jgi:hypothetical protein
MAIDDHVKFIIYITPQKQINFYFCRKGTVPGKVLKFKRILIIKKAIYKQSSIFFTSLQTKTVLILLQKDNRRKRWFGKLDNELRSAICTFCSSYMSSSRQNQHNGFATSRDPDKPAHPRSLIRIHMMFAISFSTCNRVCKRTAWILIRLRGCACWSGSMLVANALRTCMYVGFVVTQLMYFNPFKTSSPDVPK